MFFDIGEYVIKAIMACETSGGVGMAGQLPWPHIERDFHWFMDNTLGGVIVLGSTTWNDPQLGHPMPDRISYVVTSQPEKYPNAHGTISSNIQASILEIAKQFPDKTTWIIGGVNLIEQTLPIIAEFYLSVVPGSYTCDRWLPMDILGTWHVRWEDVYPEVTFRILENPNTAI